MAALLHSWDGEVEKAVEIIAANQENMDQLAQINAELSLNEAVAYTEKENQLIDKLIQQQQLLLNSIKSERTEVAGRMKQLNQKNKVMNNYISVKRESIFIDKGF